MANRLALVAEFAAVGEDVRLPTSVQSKMQLMKATTYEATVENGQIKLPDTVRHTKVFVVVPLSQEESERFSIMTAHDGLPVIRTTSGTITSHLVKEIEAQTA